MKVALVNLTTTTQFGGVETFVWQLAQNLTAAGGDVTIFGGTGDILHTTDAAVRQTSYLSRQTIRRVPLLARQYGWTKLLERLSYIPGAYPAIADGTYDIVHIHKPYDFPLAALLKRRTGAKVVYSSHGRDFWPGDRRWLPSVDAITACSAYNASEVCDRYRQRSVTVIGNGVPVPPADALAPDPATRQALGIAPDAPLLLWAGRLERWKGTIDALRALALMDTRAHLVIAGSGPEASRLRDAAHALGIAEHVHFLGAVPHAAMGALHRAADIVIGTSFANETFGITLAEASAFARPVVATNFGGFREVVRDGETGLLVPPRNSATLAATLDLLLEDPQRRAAMGSAGRKFVAESFSWERVTARVQAVYRDVCGDTQ